VVPQGEPGHEGTHSQIAVSCTLSNVHPFQVPAVAYGGPAVSPEKPSPESAKIAESSVLLDFVADLRPDLLPSDPVARAQARFVVNTISTKVIPAILDLNYRGNNSSDALLAAFEEFQALLPAEGFVAGKWSIADASLAPFVGRLDAITRHGLGKFAPEEGQKVQAELFQSPKFARVQKYWKDVSSRESWKKTWDEVRCCFGFLWTGDTVLNAAQEFIVARRREQLARA
jgi:glutathione S-transferase